jgi:ribose 1,5-bisphosphokinase
MSGVFVAVVGPSGAGKDSLLHHARDRLAHAGRIVFVRRTITRPVDPQSEDHDTLDPAAFRRAARDGAFALSWHAHGLDYGLPVALETDLAAGRVVVANLSRAVLPALLARYPGARIVAVTASRDIIARRLAARGRESEDAIKNRLARTIDRPLPEGAIEIDNSGPLEIAGTRFVDLLQQLTLPQPA